MSIYRDDLPSGALHHMMGYLDDDTFEDAILRLREGTIKHPDNPIPRGTNEIAGDEVTLDDLGEVYDYYCYTTHCELSWNELVDSVPTYGELKAKYPDDAKIRFG